MAILLDGKKLSASLREELKARVEQLKARGITPGLGVIRVGDDAASEVYVRNKARMCERLGMHSVVLHLPEDTTQEQLLARIDEMNRDPALHGILVQLPLPPHIQEDAVTARIDPKKDVDGFCSESLGALLKGEPGFVPCTPKGILRLMESAGISLRGKHAVVVGRSMIGGQAGVPAAALAGRHRDRLPQPHPKPVRHHPAGRRAGCRRRKAAAHHRRLCQRGRRCHRRGHQPHARRSFGRRSL